MENAVSHLRTYGNRTPLGTKSAVVSNDVKKKEYKIGERCVEANAGCAKGEDRPSRGEPVMKGALEKKQLRSASHASRAASAWKRKSGQGCRSRKPYWVMMAQRNIKQAEANG